ncbi:MAG: hypothetical protein LBE38_07505 [Deltaproteobacteria bacterium]|jgi:hypothetical protein|nr:hypothetical protein [Deltaproteobacteria bacterium]
MSKKNPIQSIIFRELRSTDNIINLFKRDPWSYTNNLLTFKDPNNPEVSLEKILVNRHITNFELGVAQPILTGKIFPNSECFSAPNPDVKGLDTLNYEYWEEMTMNWLKERTNGELLFAANLKKPGMVPHVLQFIVEGKHFNGYRRALLNEEKRSMFQSICCDYENYMSLRGFQTKRAVIKPSYKTIEDYGKKLNVPEKSQIHDRAHKEICSGSKSLIRELASMQNKEYSVKKVHDFIINKASNIWDNLFDDFNKQVSGLMTRCQVMGATKDKCEKNLARLESHCEKFKKEADNIRDLDLTELLTKLYFASETGKNGEGERELLLPDGRIITVSQDSWKDTQNNSEGQGAINLVKYLSGYDGSEISKILFELSLHFDTFCIARAYSRHLSFSVDEEYQKILKEPFDSPLVVEKNWVETKNLVSMATYIPSDFLQALFEIGKISCDNKKRLILLSGKQRDSVFVAEFSGAKNDYTIYEPNQDASPFFIRRNVKKVVILNDPIESLQYLSYDLENTVIVVGKNTKLEKILPFLGGKSVEINCHKGECFKRIASFLNEKKIPFSISQKYKKGYEPWRRARFIRNFRIKPRDASKNRTFDLVSFCSAS